MLNKNSFNFRTLLCSIALLFCAGAALNSGFAAEKAITKGVWLRPFNTEAAVKEQLDNIKKAGFDAVFVETFYHGFTLYNSEYVPQRPEFNGVDFMKLYVDGCHQRGMQFHAWIEVFYWEVDTVKYPQFPKTPLFEKHPDWETKLKDGSRTGNTETAHFFAEPAHPEVRAFLANYIKEMITKYDVDGVNLDYIRYPFGKASGYSDYTRKAYKEISGIDPMDIPEDANNEQWKKWVEYREDMVNKTVEEIKKARDESGKKVVLSAAIFGPYKQQRYKENKCQNWMKMISEGLIDVVIPMAYSIELSDIEKDIMNVKEDVDKTKHKVELMPVLAIQKKSEDEYSGKGHPRISSQYQIIKKLGLPGFSVFCYDWMMDSEEGLFLL